MNQNTFEKAARDFSTLLDGSAQFLEGGRYLAAAICGSLAARSAWFQNPGIFASGRLENTLLKIGRSCVVRDEGSADLQIPKAGALHVLSTASEVAGDTRFVWRWMRIDSAVPHSVAITRQQGKNVPRELETAAVATGGKVHILDSNSQDLLSQAALLRQLAIHARLVFVHTYPDDPLPVLAFADPIGLPRIALINQSDHTFWLGGSIADLVIELRESGRRLSILRRGIPASRLALLPIPILDVPQVGNRHIAKRRLGIEGSKVVLSIAVGFKFYSTGAPTFQDLVDKLLRADSTTVFIVVGPRGDEGSWKYILERFPDRLRMPGPTSNTGQYFDAADVFVDSYPFASNTSLLEAGIRGLPLVSFAPHKCYAEVLCGGGYALDKVLICESGLEECAARVQELLANAEQRRRVGARTQETILNLHGENNWRNAVHDVYRCLLSLDPVARTHNDVDIQRVQDSKLSELLRNLYRFSGANVSIVSAAEAMVASLRLRDRYTLIGLLRQLDPTCSRDMVLPGSIARALRWVQRMRLTRQPNCPTIPK